MTVPQPHYAAGWAVAGMVGAIVVFATVGDLLLASAMRRLDLDAVWAERGLPGAIRAVLGSSRFAGGVGGMTCSMRSRTLM